MRDRKGFTLAELLIVVAVIAVLVSISIPIFTSQLHKARVATDWANLRSYFAEIQADFIETGKYNDDIPNVEKDGNWFRTEIVFLDEKKVKMKAGYFAIRHESSGKGYQIAYNCNDYLNDHEKHSKCELILGQTQ